MSEPAYIIYSKNSCPNCDIAKMQAMLNGLDWKEVLIPVHVEQERQKFIQQFPQARSFPYVTLHGQHLGGLTAFKKHLKEQSVQNLQTRA